MTIDPYKMLLVDDDPRDIELVQLAIRDLSFIQSLDIVQDGAQAIAYLLGSSPEFSMRPLPRFVLMDLNLPRMTGIEVLQRLRNHPSTQYLPVVIMTSSSAESDLRDCYNLGVNSYVVKPLSFERFQTLAQQVGNYWMTINEPLLQNLG